MSETISLKKKILTQHFFAILVSVISIAVAFYFLWSFTILNGTPLAYLYLFFIPIPVILSVVMNFCREDGEFIWAIPILILVFSVLFVGYFNSETSEDNYVKYDQYKKVIQTNPDLGEMVKYKVEPDFKKIEADSVIKRYEMLNVFDSMEVIQSAQKSIEHKQKQALIEVQAKQIKASFGQ